MSIQRGLRFVDIAKLIKKIKVGEYLFQKALRLYRNQVTEPTFSKLDSGTTGEL